MSFDVEGVHHAPASRIALGVSRDFGDGGGNASLVLRFEAQQFGEFRRPPARGDHILIVLQRHGGKVDHGPTDELGGVELA